VIIDLRLADVHFELWALEEHLIALEANIEYLKKEIVAEQKTD
jgi:hypothetical protein